MPEALTGMTRLHTLIWLAAPSNAELPWGEGGEGDASWLRHLRRLALPLDAAANSCEALEHAGALKTLCLCSVSLDGRDGDGDGDDHNVGGQDYPWERLPEVFETAALALPSLRRLAHEPLPAMEHTYFSPAFPGGSVPALHAKPALRIDAKARALLGQLQQGYA